MKPKTASRKAAKRIRKAALLKVAALRTREDKAEDE